VRYDLDWNEHEHHKPKVLNLAVSYLNCDPYPDLVATTGGLPSAVHILRGERSRIVIKRYPNNCAHHSSASDGSLSMLVCREGRW